MFYSDTMFRFYCRPENMLKSEYESFLSRFTKKFQERFRKTPINSCKNDETSQPKDFNRLVMQYVGVIHLHTITVKVRIVALLDKTFY